MQAKLNGKLVKPTVEQFIVVLVFLFLNTFRTQLRPLVSKCFKKKCYHSKLPGTLFHDCLLGPKCFKLLMYFMTARVR